MSPRWFVLEAIFWKLWPCLFFWTAHFSTQDSENVYERCVQQIFDPVLVARSWVSATKWGPLAKLWAVKKNKHGHNFQNIASKMNQRWVIDYDPTLIRFGSDILKIWHRVLKVLYWVCTVYSTFNLKIQKKWFFWSFLEGKIWCFSCEIIATLALWWCQFSLFTNRRQIRLDICDRCSWGKKITPTIA